MKEVFDMDLYYNIRNEQLLTHLQITLGRMLFAASVDGPFSNDLLQFVQYNLGGMTYLIFLSLEFKVYISFRLLIDNMPCQV